MMHPDQALQIILEHTPFQPVETRPLEQVSGLILAEEVLASCAIPAFDNSAMDGYGVRAANLDSASPSFPVFLKKVDFVPAGTPNSRELQTGECYQIATGAEIPPGVDAVVMKESIKLEGEQVLFFRPPQRGENIRLRGEDIQEGETVLQPGVRLAAPQIALLAAFGYARVKVYRPLHVAVLATGSELVDVSESLQPGQIRDTNSYMLEALIRELNCTCTRMGIVEDNPGLLRDKLKEALAADMVMISGGVSVGEHDYVKRVLGELGVEEVFWKVGIKPGKPFFFGKKGTQLIFGMPGNPASSYVVYEEFVKPALRKALGYTRPQPESLQAQLDSPITERSGRRQFLRACLRQENGKFYVQPMSFQGSHSLRSLAGANALIVVPENAPSFEIGSVVSVHLSNTQCLT
ncbi:gephyrin-like molybdotransferase Glp [Deltaproteobacteria bacterium TL4]